MKRAIYLSVISAVTAVCMVVGICYHMLGRGGNFPGISFFYGKWGETVSLENEELASFEEISVVSDIMNVTLKQGSGYSISYKSSKKILPEYKVENGVLSLTQKQQKRSWNNFTCNVTITVPKTASLGAITINSNCGDTKMDGIMTASIHADADVGDIKISNCSVGDVVLQTDVGDCKFEDCSFDNMDIVSDIGDIKVESTKDLSAYNMDIYTDLGDVKINGQKQRKAYSTEGSSGNLLKIVTDCGDIHVSD